MVHYRPLVIVVLSITVAIYFLIHFFRKPIVTGDPKELPFGDKVAHEMAQENDGSPRNEEHPPARAPKTDGFVQERKV